jgi:pectate lyase-like protein
MALTRINLSVQAKRATWVDVRSNGAKGDGTTDDSAAINATIAAVVAAGGGTVYFPGPSTYIISAATLTITGNNITFRGDGRELSTLMMGAGSSVFTLVSTGAHSDITFVDLGFDGNFINNTYPAATLNTAINGTGSTRLRVRGCRFHAFGYSSPVDAQYTQCISSYNNFDIEVSGCLFLSNLAYEINMNNTVGARVTDNEFGFPALTDSKTNVNWWDTYAGGFGTICIGSRNVYFAHNRTFGVSRSSTLSAFGYMISAGGGDGQCAAIQVHSNAFQGVGNSRGTLTVTQGSGVITGSNTAFVSTDVHRMVTLEGDATAYVVTTYTSATQVTVTPVVVRTNAANLRYQFQNSGDAISIADVSDLSIVGNAVYDSGDMACDISANAPFSTQHVVFANNIMARSQVGGLYIGGPVFNILVTGNLFIDNNRKGLSGHQGAVDISPTNEGQTAAASMWHMSFLNNQFLDDQVAVTQLYAFQIESGQTAHVFGCSENASHIFGFASAMALHDTTTTATQWSTMFAYPLTFTLPTLPTYANNAAAVAGGLIPGTPYLITGTDQMGVVH